MNINPNSNPNLLKNTNPPPKLAPIMAPMPVQSAGGAVSHIVETAMWTNQGDAPEDPMIIESEEPTSTLSRLKPTKNEEALFHAITKNDGNEVTIIRKADPTIRLHIVEKNLLPSKTLWGACALGNIKNIPCLLAAGFPPVSVNAFSPLAIAIRAGHYDIARLLISKLDPKFSFWKFLDQPTLRQEARALIDAGFTPDPAILETLNPDWAVHLIEILSAKCNVSPFEYACGHRLWSFIPELMEKNLDPLVIQIMKSGHRANFGPLLEDERVDIHSTGPDGVTALQLAVRYRQVKLAEILLKRLAVVDRYDGMGRTPRNELEDAGQCPELQQLLDTQPTMPTGLLELAKENKWADVINTIRGANIPLGALPEAIELLLLAVQQENIQVVAELMRLGANIHEQNSSGQSALALALTLGHMNIFDYLVQHGATFIRWPETILWTTICAPHVIHRFISFVGSLDQRVVAEMTSMFFRDITDLLDNHLLDGVGLLIPKLHPAATADWDGFDELFLVGHDARNQTLMKACVSYLARPVQTLSEILKNSASIHSAQILLDGGLDLSKLKPRTAYRILVKALQNPSMLDFLLTNGANPNIEIPNQPSVLSKAFTLSNKEAALLLLQAGATPISGNQLLLSRAIRLGWEEVCDKLIAAGASCEGMDWNALDSDLSRRCYEKLVARIDAYEAQLSQALPGHYVATGKMREITSSEDYFVRREGPLDLRINGFGQSMRIGMGGNPLFEIETFLYPRSLHWLFSQPQISFLLEEHPSARLQEQLAAGLTAKYWTNLPVLLEPDHQHRQYHLYYLNPADLSEVKETFSVHNMNLIPQRAIQIRKNIYREAFEQELAAYRYIDSCPGFKLKTVETGFQLSFKCHPSVHASGYLTTLVTGYGLERLKKEMQIIARRVQVMKDYRDLKKTYPWMLFDCNKDWDEFALYTDSEPAFEIKELTWAEVLDVLPLVDRARNALVLNWRIDRWGAERLSTPQTVRKPKEGLQFSWLTSELFRLRDHPALTSLSFMELNAGLNQYINIASCGRGAPGVPDSDVSIYKQIRENTLLIIEDLQQEKDEERRAGILINLAQVGFECGPRIRDASKEQREIAAGKVESSFAEGSMEQFENTILDSWVKVLVSQMFCLVISEKAKRQTVHLDHYICLILNKVFGVAFSEDEMAKIRDPFIIYYGTLGFCPTMSEEELVEVLDLADEHPLKQKAVDDAWEFASEQLKLKLVDSLYDVYMNHMKAEMAMNDRLVRQIRARALDFVEEYLLTEENKSELAQLRITQNRHREKLTNQCNNAKAELNKRLHNLNIKQYEKASKDLDLVERLGDSVLPLKAQLEKLSKDAKKSVDVVRGYLALKDRIKDAEKDLKVYNDQAVEEYEKRRDQLCSPICDALQMIVELDGYKYTLSHQGLTILQYRGGFLEARTS